LFLFNFQNKIFPDTTKFGGAKAPNAPGGYGPVVTA